MLPTYEACADPYLDKFTQVMLTRDNESSLAAFLFKSVKSYLSETNQLTINNPHDWSRKANIMGGEMALDQFLRTKEVQLELDNYYSYKSKGLFDNTVKIKVFPAGQLPVIYKHSSSPIVFVMVEDRRTYRICGVATPRVLNSFHNPKIVDESVIHHRDRKTVFYGLYELRPFHDLNSLYRGAFT